VRECNSFSVLRTALNYKFLGSLSGAYNPVIVVPSGEGVTQRILYGQ